MKHTIKYLTFLLVTATAPLLSSSWQLSNKSMGDLKIYIGRWTAMPSSQELADSMFVTCRASSQQGFDDMEDNKGIVVEYNGACVNNVQGARYFIPIGASPGPIYMTFRAGDGKDHLIFVSIEISDEMVLAYSQFQLFSIGHKD